MEIMYPNQVVMFCHQPSIGFTCILCTESGSSFKCYNVLTYAISVTYQSLLRESLIEGVSSPREDERHTLT